MGVYVNRILNLKKIRVVGFDMDYTLVRYNSDEFERLTYNLALDYLIARRNYPDIRNRYQFDVKRSIPGLVIDKRHGNLLQINRFGKVKTSYHGLELLEYQKQQQIYENRAIDPRDSDYHSLDTSFSLSCGILYAHLVDARKSGLQLPDFTILAEDVLDAVDMVHRDGSLKDKIMADPGRYVVKDPGTAELLERYIHYGKKLVLITNSDYRYTKALMEHSLDPYLKKADSWKQVFELVITLASKPAFFEKRNPVLMVKTADGLLQNHDGPLQTGIYQGGDSIMVEDYFKANGSEILYIGDHIYGDVISIKKKCGWRTALVMEDLATEIEGLQKSRDIQATIDGLMEQKMQISAQIEAQEIRHFEGKKVPRRNLDALFGQLETLNSQLTALITSYNACFNPHWGEILRAGNEESRFAEQLERYACIYMSRVSDLNDYTARCYFRPAKRLMPHELIQA